MRLGLDLRITGGGSRSLTPPPQTGAMNRTENGSGLTSITFPYDLASSVAILAVTLRYVGTLTGLTVQHGLQTLNPIHTANDTVSGIFTGLYTASGLTLELANVLILPVGGATVGPAIIRINDEYGSSPILSAWQANQQGAGLNANQGVMYTGPAGIVAYALGCDLTDPAPYAGPSTALKPTLSTIALNGVRVDAPVFTGGVRWSEVSGWWEHSGAISSNAAPALPADVSLPFGYELEVDIPAGGSLSIQIIAPDGSIKTDAIRSPSSGMVRFYHNDMTLRRFNILGSGAVKFRGLKYVVSPLTLQGVFGKSDTAIASGYRTWFYFPVATRFSGVMAQVYQ